MPDGNHNATLQKGSAEYARRIAAFVRRVLLDALGADDAATRQLPPAPRAAAAVAAAGYFDNDSDGGGASSGRRGGGSDRGARTLPDAAVAANQWR